MILLLFLFMPVAVCFGWLILNYFVARRTTTYGIFTFLLIMLGLFLITDSCYANPDINENLELLAYIRLLELLTGPSLIPLMWMYLYQLKHKSKFATWQWAWIIVPIVLITAGALITHLNGIGKVSRYLGSIYLGGYEAARVPKGDDHLLFSYYLFTGFLYRVAIGIELLSGFIMVIIHTRKYNFDAHAFRRFWRKGEAISVVQIQYMNLFIPIIIVVASELYLAVGAAVPDKHGVYLQLFVYCAVRGERNAQPRTIEPSDGVQLQP